MRARRNIELVEQGPDDEEGGVAIIRAWPLWPAHEAGVDAFTTLLQHVGEELAASELGACVGHPDPGLWHRDDRTAEDFSVEDTRMAVAICRDCPVRKWCAERFDTESYGVYGGRTASTRAERRSRAKDAAGNRERDRERLRQWRERKRIGDRKIV